MKQIAQKFMNKRDQEDSSRLINYFLKFHNSNS